MLLLLLLNLDRCSNRTIRTAAAAAEAATAHRVEREWWWRPIGCIAMKVMHVKVFSRFHDVMMIVVLDQGLKFIHKGRLTRQIFQW